MKIALIGSAPSSVQLGPYLDQHFDQYLGGKPSPQYPPSDVIDDTWQIWGVSPGAFAVVPRADRWFELHRWEPGKPWFSPEYVEFLKRFRGPVYTGGVVPEIQNHVVFPLARVEERFTSYFLHSSLSPMLALAILEIEDYRAAHPEHDPEEDIIGLWGVDMSATEEYGDQRAGCHFFLLEAMRSGIKVYTPPESCLLRPKPVYGISEWDPAYIKATTKMREVNARRTDAQTRLHQATIDNAALGGVVDGMNYFINTWMSPYGMPGGIVIRHEPGTGLGGAFTMPRPVETMDAYAQGAGSAEEMTTQSGPADDLCLADAILATKIKRPGKKKKSPKRHHAGGITWVDREYDERTRKKKAPKRR